MAQIHNIRDKGSKANTTITELVLKQYGDFDMPLFDSYWTRSAPVCRKEMFRDFIANYQTMVIVTERLLDEANFSSLQDEDAKKLRPLFKEYLITTGWKRHSPYELSF